MVQTSRSTATIQQSGQVKIKAENQRTILMALTTRTL
jgi:hypothetical protein